MYHLSVCFSKGILVDQLLLFWNNVTLGLYTDAFVLPGCCCCDMVRFWHRISHIYLAEDVPLVFLPASKMPGSPMGAEQEGFGKSILVWIDARKKRISSNCSRVLFVEIVSL